MTHEKRLKHWQNRVAEMQATDDYFATDEENQEASDLYCDDDLNIDSEALVSRGDGGFWVQAWVWVPRDEPEEDEDN